MGLRDRFRQWACKHRAYLDDMSSAGKGYDRVVSVPCCDCGKVLKTTARGAGGLSLPVNWLGYRREKADAE